ncbi:MAG: FAD synthase [Candidatus Diapherotrites archaeon]|nr:FAD synthase [Candidatus Diapherotrites archaeon]
MRKSIKVLAFGTFDLLHKGHEFYLREAKKLGNRLAVIVARDLNVWRAKGYLPKQSEKERLREVKKLKFVDKALLGDENYEDKYRLVKKINPDIIALGYDQRPSDEFLRSELHKLHLNPEIVRIAPYKPEEHKSSKIRERLRNK